MTFPFPAFNAGVSEFPRATIDITGLTLTNAAMVELFIVDVGVDTDDATLALKVYIGGSISTNTYRIFNIFIESSSTTEINESTDANAYFLLTDTTANWNIGSAAAEGYSATVRIHNPTQSKYKYFTINQAWASPDDDAVFSDTIHVLNDTGTITGFQLYSPSGALLTRGAMHINKITTS